MHIKHKILILELLVAEQNRLQQYITEQRHIAANILAGGTRGNEYLKPDEVQKAVRRMEDISAALSAACAIPPN